jgi:hypothetical protein
MDQLLDQRLRELRCTTRDDARQFTYDSPGPRRLG